MRPGAGACCIGAVAQQHPVPAPKELCLCELYYSHACDQASGKSLEQQHF